MQDLTNKYPQKLFGSLWETEFELCMLANVTEWMLIFLAMKIA